MSSSTPIEPVVNHHVLGDDDELVVVAGRILTPDEMASLRAAAAWLQDARR